VCAQELIIGHLARKTGRELTIGHLARKTGRELTIGHLARKTGRELIIGHLARKTGRDPALPARARPGTPAAVKQFPGPAVATGTDPAWARGQGSAQRS
jgi:hypothetical protein